MAKCGIIHAVTIYLIIGDAQPTDRLVQARSQVAADIIDSGFTGQLDGIHFCFPVLSRQFSNLTESIYSIIGIDSRGS
jgi:hypothetical protein